MLNKLVKELEKNKIIEADKQNIYKYGLEVVTLKIFAFAIAVVFSLAIGDLKTLFAVLLALVPLRKYAGGMHAPSKVLCLFFTEIILIMVQIIYINRLINIKLLILSAILSYIFICCFSPQDNKNHRLSMNQRKELRRKTIYVCIIECTVLGISLYFKNPIMIYSICLSACIEAVLIMVQLFFNSELFNKKIKFAH